ncbi:MAG: serine/threonine-protein kinase [Verrucomicrobiota bacterium]
MASACPSCGGCLLGEAADPSLRAACPHCIAHLLSWDAEAPPEQPATSMGPYQLIHEIARGGMGTVWLATRSTDGVQVALKLLPHSLGADPSRLARFRAEATLAARLVHPHIVAIRDIGEHEGVPYFTMDLVDGPDLGEVAGRRPMAPRDAARMVRTVAMAVHFAHEQGVLHRDIKPTNVLLGPDGEPRVTDFGLARLLDMDARLTATGETMGSPSFMAPEQVSGQQLPAGVRTDVHGLGGLLYFCLTGRAPFAAESVAAALAKVVESKPVPPREWVPSVPGPLEAVTMRCLARDPSARYPSAAAVADDLERVLLGQPVVAQASSTPRLGMGWLRLSRSWGLVILAIACLATLGSVAWTASARRRRAEDEANRAKAEATALARFAMDMMQAGQAAEAGNGHEALRLLEAMIPTSGLPDPRGLEWFALRRRVATLDGLVHPQQGPRPAESLAWNHWPVGSSPTRLLFSPDGSVLAVAFAQSKDPMMLAWRVAHPEAMPATLPGIPIVLDASGQAALVAAQDGSLQARRASDGHLLAKTRRPLDAAATQWEWSPDGAFVAWLDAAQQVQLMHVASGQALPGPTGRAASFQVSPDGNALLLAGSSGATLFTLRPRQQSLVVTGAVASVAFDPLGRIAAASLADGSVCAVHIATKTLAARWKAQTSSPVRLAFSPDGRTLLTGGADGWLRFWNTTLWREVLKLPFPQPMTHVAISPDAQRIAVVAAGRLHLLDTTGASAPKPNPVAALNSPWLDPAATLENLPKSDTRPLPPEALHY